MAVAVPIGVKRLSIPGSMPTSRDSLARWHVPVDVHLLDKPGVLLLEVRRQDTSEIPYDLELVPGPVCASLVSSESRTEIHPSAEPP